ncbi:MAG: hypothetical protein GF364_07095 [Candidatus Lokiarchaeota archaeon]|nr:hypothetical protein [Candidatus Lokiarchaeota archaeon]
MSDDQKVEREPIEEHVSMRAKLAYGIANTGHQFLGGTVFGAIDIFYLKLFGIDPSTVAWSWILFIAWNMINDPLIGIIEERTKSDLGRRIPYLRYGAPFYVISFILVWFPIANTEIGLMWNHLLMLFIFDTIYSMVGLVTYAMPAEMAITARERNSIVIWTTIIGVIGIAGSILIPTIYLGDVPDTRGFRIISIILGIVSGIAIYLSSFFIKENKYTQIEEPLGFMESIKETFKNKAFLIVEIVIFATVLMQNILQGFFVFIFDYIIDIDPSEFATYIVIAVLLVIVVLIVYLINKKIESVGIKKIVILGSLISAFGFGLLMIFGFSYGVNAANKMPVSFGFIPLLFIVGGLIVYLMTNQPLMGDCIDKDEILTGKRRETTYSGVNALITKPAVSLAHYVFLNIIKLYGYDKNVENPLAQPESVATGVLIAFSIVPMICLIIAAIVLSFYPLDGPEWQAEKHRIHRIHIEKEKKYIEYLKKQEELEENRKRLFFI